jgi:hypothetical protein
MEKLLELGEALDLAALKQQMAAAAAITAASASVSEMSTARSKSSSGGLRDSSTVELTPRHKDTATTADGSSAFAVDAGEESGRKDCVDAFGEDGKEEGEEADGANGSDEEVAGEAEGESELEEAQSREGEGEAEEGAAEDGALEGDETADEGAEVEAGAVAAAAAEGQEVAAHCKAAEEAASVPEKDRAVAIASEAAVANDDVSGASTTPEQIDVEAECGGSRASLGGLGSSTTVIEVPGIPAAALAVGGDMSSAIPASEKALMKGLYR